MIKILVLIIFTCSFLFCFGPSVQTSQDSKDNINRIHIRLFLNISDYMVVGEVVEVFEIDEIRIAKFKVSKRVKGKPKQKYLYFLASPVSNDDSSEAYKGEKLFLCLSVIRDTNYNKFFKEAEKFQNRLKEKINGNILYRISSNGLGRMHIKKFDGREHLKLSPLDIEIPEYIKKMKGPKSRALIDLPPLDEIIKYLKQEMKENEKMLNLIQAAKPKDEDFRLVRPKGWSQNLIKNVDIIDISSGESKKSAGLIIDGKPATTWTSKRYEPAPIITIDTGRMIIFNRIVIFNRHTDMRGTAGGNNAAKEIEILISTTEVLNDMILLCILKLQGPEGACLRTEDGGIVCYFIDRTEPQIFEIETTAARLIQIKFVSAHWGEEIPEAWKSSFSLSEIMLFHTEY